MLINIHLFLKKHEIENQENKYDTISSPCGTIAALLNIEEKLGQKGIIGIDEIFPGIKETRDKIEQLIKKDISKKEITTLLFTVLLYNSESTIQYIEDLKRKFKNKINIVVGGQLVKLTHKAYLKNKNIDCVCIGDAEIILPKLLKDLKNKKLKRKYEGWVANEKEKKFSGFSYNNFWKIEERMKKQKKDFGFSQLTIQGPGGPGCAWAISNSQGACSFCALQDIKVKNETTVEEYLENERVIEGQLHPDLFFDVANQFLPTLSREKGTEWLKEYIHIRKIKKIKAKKYAYLTVPSINDKIAKLLKKAGICEVYLGIDHFNEKALKEENKSFRKKETLKICLDALKKNKIKFRAGIVLCSAKENQETLESVRKGIKWIVKDYKEIISAIGIFPEAMLPGSKDFKKMKDINLCPELFIKFDSKGYLSTNEQKMLAKAWVDYNSEISIEEVVEFQREMFKYLKKENIFWYSTYQKSNKLTNKKI